MWCVVVAKTIEEAKIELASNSDGEELIVGDLAILEPLEWETDTLRKGTQVFLDVNYTFSDVPKELEGKTFIRSNFFGTRKVCLKSGVVYAITPSKERGRFSRATELERIGFSKARIPEFQAFSNGWRAICSVYQKRLEKDERIDIGSPGLVLTPNAPWCVIVAKTPSPSGKVSDQVGYHSADVASDEKDFRTTFAPSLAQDYTIAAQVPDHRKYFIHDPGMTRLPSGHFLVAAPC